MENRSKALLRKIKLKTNHRLNSEFIGEYHSAFKGNGLYFDSVRAYQYGDAIKNIDWNVSARMENLHVKEYIEERELNIVMLVDVSSSLEFGSVCPKQDVLQELVALFIYLAKMNNDSISVALFSDKIEKYYKPRKGKNPLALVNEIASFKPESKKTDIGVALDFVQNVIKKRSIVLVISDFLDDEYLLRMQRLKKKHDVIPVRISDPFELQQKLYGLTEFYDLETGESFLSDVYPDKKELDSLYGFDIIDLSTDEPIENSILRYFKKRNRSRKMAG